MAGQNRTGLTRCGPQQGSKEELARLRIPLSIGQWSVYTSYKHGFLEAVAIMTHPVWETRHRRGERIKAHRHLLGYVSLALDGAYEEVSLDGRFVLAAGSIVMHPPFHAHANVFPVKDAIIINAPLAPADQRPGSGAAGRCSPAARAALEALMRSDPLRGAQAALEELGTPDTCAAPAWLTEMRRRLSAPEARPVADIAAAAGRSPEHAARAFRRWFQTAPSEIRGEARLRRALTALLENAPGAGAAAESGYADQAHMCRDFRNRLGMTPEQARRLLRQICSIQSIPARLDWTYEPYDNVSGAVSGRLRAGLEPACGR